MITGTYIFYEDGKEVARKCNVITKFGKRFLTNFISGNGKAGTFRKDIALGIDTTSSTENDTRLGFEFYRLPVLFGATDIQTTNGITSYSVIYKTTIPQDVNGEIYEIGLYPSSRSSINNFDSKYISDFDDYLSWFDSSGNNPTLVFSNYRIGGNLLRMSSSSGVAKEYKSNIGKLDLSGYSLADTIKIAYYREDLNLSSIKVRLYSDTNKYYEATITPTSGTGYKISDDIPLSVFFANATSPGPDINNINQVGIVITPTSGITNVGMDGLRINDEDTFDPFFGLISRSSSATPILSKKSGRQVDVEYRLDLGF